MHAVVHIKKIICYGRSLIKYIVINKFHLYRLQQSSDTKCTDRNCNNFQFVMIQIFQQNIFLFNKLSSLTSEKKNNTDSQSISTVNVLQFQILTCQHTQFALGKADAEKVSIKHVHSDRIFSFPAVFGLALFCLFSSVFFLAD